MSRVTVIVTCFNDGRFLPDALASVRAQTHRDIELIVTDDESTDASTLRLLEVLEASGTRVLRNAHGGLSANRNHALAVASGEYVVCLDADDALSPDYVEAAAAVLDAAPRVGVVAPDMAWFGTDVRLEPTQFSLGVELAGNRLPVVSMFRRDPALSLGGYAETLPHHEDWDLWLGLLGQGWEVCLLGLPGHRRRAHPGQMTTGLNARTNPPVFAAILRRHQGLYLRHAEEFWAAVLTEREMLRHFKRRYGRLEDAVSRVAALLRRR